MGSEARDRAAALETALEIELRGESAPDTAARLFAAEVRATPRRRGSETWLVAALLLLAAGVVVFLAWEGGSARTQSAGEQDPERTFRVWHRKAYVPADPEAAVADLATATGLRAVRPVLLDPDAGTWIRVVENPLEGLAALFGQRPLQPEVVLEEAELRGWQDALGAILAGPSQDAPAWRTAPVELVFEIPERGALVWVLERVDGAGATLRCQGLPRAWRGEAVERALTRIEDQTAAALRAACESRGLAVGREQLAALPREATRLRLHACGPEAAGLLASFETLRGLDLSGSPRMVTAEAFGRFRALESLRSLVLPADGVGIEALRALRGASLEELFLGDPMPLWTGLGMQQVVRDSPLDDEVAAGLGALGGLRELVVMRSSVTDLGLEALAELPLRSLTLGSVAIDGRGFAAFATGRARELRRLGLIGFRTIHPDAFAAWSQLPSLDRLSLINGRLPAFGTVEDEELPQAPAIEALTVHGCLFETGMAAGLPRLLAQLPGCRRLQIALLRGQERELAECRLPATVERLEVLAEDREALQAGLQDFVARHPDLDVSLDQR